MRHQRLLLHRHFLLLPLRGLLRMVSPPLHLRVDPDLEHSTRCVHPRLHAGRIHRLQQQDGDLGTTHQGGTQEDRRLERGQEGQAGGEEGETAGDRTLHDHQQIEH